MGSPETQAPDPLIKSQGQRGPEPNIDKKGQLFSRLACFLFDNGRAAPLAVQRAWRLSESCLLKLARGPRHRTKWISETLQGIHQSSFELGFPKIGALGLRSR